MLFFGSKIQLQFVFRRKLVRLIFPLQTRKGAERDWVGLLSYVAASDVAGFIPFPFRFSKTSASLRVLSGLASVLRRDQGGREQFALFYIVDRTFNLPF